ncbi:hypothetical protein BDZ91DRAFT_841103, partial [Kalaharituber pfeilii]
SAPDVIKGLLLRNLRWWSRRSDTIFQPDGTLSIGYVYPHMYMTENYNSPGSPYWGMKVFLVLALPPSHPFWVDREAPHPFASRRAAGEVIVTPLKHPLHIMVSALEHTYLLSTGQACHYPLKATQAKYGKFSYSATFGFCVPTGSYMLDQYALDGMVGFSDDGGETWKARRVVEDPRIEFYDAPVLGGEKWPVLVGTWDVFGDGDVKCTTWLVPPPPGGGPKEVTKHWYVRIHQISVARGSHRKKILSAEAGWAVYGQGKDGRILPFFPSGTAETATSGVVEGRSAPSGEGRRICGFRGRSGRDCGFACGSQSGRGDASGRERESDVAEDGAADVERGRGERGGQVVRGGGICEEGQGGEWVEKGVGRGG